jgi:hypothetical protein
LYVDGVPYGNTVTYQSVPLAGRAAIGARYSQERLFFIGELDEIRVSSTLRSPDWIWASWKSQSANAEFITYGTPQGNLVSGSIFLLR